MITGEYAELSDDDETVEIDRTPKTQNDYEAQEEDAIDAEYTLYKERRGIKEKRAEAVANQTMPYLMRVGQDEVYLPFCLSSFLFGAQSAVTGASECLLELLGHSCMDVRS